MATTTGSMGIRLRTGARNSASPGRLAGELGVTRQHLSRLELGHDTPTLPMLLSLSRQLGVSTDWLLVGRAPPRRLMSPRRSARTKASVRRRRATSSGSSRSCCAIGSRQSGQWDDC